MTKHIVIFSHGFGVRQDDHRLLTERVRWFTRSELTREFRDHPDQYLDLSWALENL